MPGAALETSKVITPLTSHKGLDLYLKCSLDSTAFSKGEAATQRFFRCLHTSGLTPPNKHWNRNFVLTIDLTETLSHKTIY